jgi:hypothetical protein
VVLLLVVIDNFNVVGRVFNPNEAETILVVYSNAMLPSTIASECLKGISGDRMELKQLADRGPFDGVELSGTSAILIVYR